MHRKDDPCEQVEHDADTRGERKRDECDSHDRRVDAEPSRDTRGNATEPPLPRSGPLHALERAERQMGTNGQMRASRAGRPGDGWDRVECARQRCAWISRHGFGKTRRIDGPGHAIDDGSPSTLGLPGVPPNKTLTAPAVSGSVRGNT